MKALGLVAILVVSCFASVCVAPVSDADSQVTSENEPWGFMKEIDSIQQIFDLLKENMPELEIDSIDDLESYIKNLAPTIGFDPEDLKIDLDGKGSICLIGEKVNDNTLSMTMAASMEIMLDLKLPISILSIIFDGEDLSDSDDFFYLHDTTIELDRVTSVYVTMNDEGRVASVLSNAERIIHIEGKTNLSYVDEVPTYSEEATQVVDHLMVSTMHAYNGYGTEGYKYLPDDDNDTQWTNNIDGTAVRVGTIHNESAGVTVEFLNVIEEAMGDDGLIINSDTHSGLMLYEMGPKNFNVTMTVVPGDGNPYVTVHDNNEDKEESMPVPFYNAFGFVDVVGPLMPLVSGMDVEITPDEANIIKEKVAECRTGIDEHTSDIKLNVFYLEKDEDLYEQEPLHTEVVDYGGLVNSTFKPQAPEGKVFIEWAVGGTDGETFMGDTRVYSDLYLVPLFGTYLDEAPTQADFDQNKLVVWKYDINDKDVDGGIDWQLLKDNIGKTVFVVVCDGDKVLYKWSLTSYGNEPASGTIDCDIIRTDVPSHVDAKFNDKKVVYLDFKASGPMPTRTLVSYNVEGEFEEGSLVDLYHDDGTNLKHLGQTILYDGHVVLDIEECSGFVIVGNATPAEDGPQGFSLGNTEIILAILAIVVIAIVAIYFFRRNA